MLPFVARIARDYLIVNAPVDALVDGQVHSPRILHARNWPLLLLTPIADRSISDLPVDHAVEGNLQVEAYGRDPDDYAHARFIAATAHAELRDGLPTYDHVEGHVTVVTPDIGLQFLPVDEHDRARCMFAVRIVAHPRVPAVP